MIVNSAPRGAAEPVLAAQGLTRRFGGVVALDQLDFHVMPGEIVGLIGPNGSGKTTFFNVITGIYAADAGQVWFDGADITCASPQAIYHAGVSRTFQRSRLSLPLSIFDNIMIGNHKRLNQGLWFNLARRRAFRAEYEGESCRGAIARRRVRSPARRAHDGARRGPADDRPQAHRDLSGAG